MLIDSGKKHEIDKKFDTDELNTNLSNYFFQRLIAKSRTFKEVNFRYCTFDACYIRDCHFDSCDFTGSRFIGTSFHGSRFSGCKFDYTIFERTLIDTAILDTECPPFENLKARFARTLRTNYQQLGDALAANKAMKVELEATKVHLYKAWYSNDMYHRKKYKGLYRLRMFFAWLQFTALDISWGNGESALRLMLSVAVILATMSIVDAISFGDPKLVKSYFEAFPTALEVFLGVSSPTYYPKWYLALVTFIRLTAMGFFLSILIKRFNRR